MTRLERCFAWLKRNKKEVLLVTVLLLIAGIAHGYNMFHYPYYESDEGTYMGQAWSLVTKGQLAPYSYWYDHAPAGWILIAVWTKLTGGFFTFGFSINSGRVLMLVLHLLSAVLLYGIAKKLSSNRKIVGAMAVLLFSLSPLAIYFQRRVLLDNIMVFWLLLAIFLLLHYKNKLRYIFLSAAAFGIAVLSKETAIFFIPICMYIIYREADRKHRKFALLGWLSASLLIISLYGFYALFKSEFFPAGSALGGSGPHVSLLQTLKYQSGRTGGGPFGTGGGSFYANFLLWCRADPLIMWAGVVTTVGVLLAGIRRKSSLIVGLLALSMWAFILRGGLVLEFYVIPLLPFLALATAHMAWLLARAVQRLPMPKYLRSVSSIPYVLVLAMLALMVGVYANSSDDHYSLFKSDQTTPQIQAVNWLLNRHVPGQFYAIDMYGYIDLHTKGTADNFKNAEYYWKVDGDPAIENTVLQKNYNNIDYLILTPQMQKDLPNLPLISKAAKDGLPVVSFAKDGWRATVLATRSPHQQLSASWQSYAQTFIHAGQVSDPEKSGQTTASLQATALLRAVWMQDKTNFDKLYSWTRTHLSIRTGTFSSLYQTTPLTDPRSDSGADSDIAMALLFAGQQWHNPTYTAQAKTLIGNIWSSEVYTIDGVPYMTAGNWANTDAYLTENPSYLSPAAYRLFQKADPTHDWSTVVATSYQVLRNCSAANLSTTTSSGLPPDWCRINKTDASAGPSLDQFSIGSEYAFDALRTPWRIALDYQWNKPVEAKQYLGSLEYLNQSYQQQGKLLAAYTHDGQPWQNYESVIGYAGAIGFFKVMHPETAQRIYTNNIVSKYYENASSAYWEDPRNAYVQTWAWLGTALYNGYLSNLAVPSSQK